MSMRVLHRYIDNILSFWILIVNYDFKQQNNGRRGDDRPHNRSVSLEWVSPCCWRQARIEAWVDQRAVAGPRGDHSFADTGARRAPRAQHGAKSARGAAHR